MSKIPEIIIPQFTPENWYWYREDGALFSSARIALVADNDEAFLEWASAGGVPSAFPRNEYGEESVAELQRVLDAYDLFASLEAYAAHVRYGHETGGITVAGSRIATDRGSQGLINSAFNLVNAAPGLVINFKGADGFVSLPKDTLIYIAIEVGKHVQMCFSVEGVVVDAIKAGVITTMVEVREAFEAALAEKAQLTEPAEPVALAA